MFSPHENTFLLGLSITKLVHNQPREANQENLPWQPLLSEKLLSLLYIAYFALATSSCAKKAEGSVLVAFF